MDWMKPLLFAFGFISELVLVRCGRSNADVGQRYEQCVLNKLSNSQHFTEEDRLRMIKVVNETNNRMQLLHLDLTNASNLRTMLRLFSAALANLAADKHIPDNFQRKEDYLCAVEMCSLSLPQRIGDELIQEVTRIFDSMRNDKNLYARTSGNAAHSSSGRRASFPEDPSELVISESNSLRLRYKRSPQSSVLYAFSSGTQYEPLEVVISNILLNSPVFFNTFKTGIPRQSAIGFSTSMIGAGLEDYEFGLVSEAQSATTNTISMLSMAANTADYAFAITNGITSALKAHQLEFLADGNEIGNALVQKLQNIVIINMPENVQAPTQIHTRVISPPIISPGFEEIKPAPDFYPENPSATPPFQSTLEMLLSESDILQNAFRNGFFPGIFGMVKDALSDYGFLISISAANMIINSLASMPPNEVSNQYAKVISKTITDILIDNGHLQNANAWLLTGKMELNVKPDVSIKADLVPNQQGSQSFSFSFDNYQTNPFFPEFPISQAQPVLPQINPDMMTFGDIEINPVFPTQFSDKFPFPSQGTEILNKPTDDNPGFKFPISKTLSPGFGGFEEKASDSFVASQPPKQQTEFSTVPKTAGSSDSAYVAMNMTSMNNYSNPDNSPGETPLNLSPPLISETLFENGPSTQDNSSSQREYVPVLAEGSVNKASTTAPQLEETSTTVPQLEETSTTAPQLEETSTTAPKYVKTQSIAFTSVIKPTSPTPYTTSRIDSISESSKRVEEILDGFDSALRALDVKSKTDKNKEIAPNVTAVEVTPPPHVLEFPAIDSLLQKHELQLIANVTGPKNVKNVTANAENVRNPGSELQPSFWPTDEPIPDDHSVQDSNNTTQSITTFEDEAKLGDPKSVISERIESVVSSSIDLIRSGQDNLPDLCRKLNELSFMVDIPPLDVCNELALVDFILNVLRKLL